MNEINSYIKSSAKDRGFSVCGITNIVNLSEQKTILIDWVKNNYNASMDWFIETIDKRADPTMLLKGAKSIIVCALYNSSVKIEGDFMNIANYSKDVDYHYRMKKMLEGVLEDLKLIIDDVSGICFVDSAPVLEKYWAQRAGIGWIGKNTLITSTLYGSMLNIGVIIIDKEIDFYDKPIKNRCGNCNKCVVSCPNGALIENTVDSRLCLSFLTIEHNGEFSSNQIKLINNSREKYIFGCDACQNNCPWNAHAIKKIGYAKTPDNKFLLSKDRWLSMGSGEFNRKYKTTPLRRCGLKNIKRNIRAFNEE